MSAISLSVKHFGPIKSISIQISRFTIFIGPQGSGKSTLAKLYSTFLWMEKRLHRGLDTIGYFEQHSRFKKRLAAYHRLESYFYDDTEIIFHGNDYRFEYREGKLSITGIGKDNPASAMVKVMYVPSERNYLSSLGNIGALKSLPASLHTFKDEYDMARRHFSNGLPLSIENVRFEFDRLNNISWLIGSDYKVRLTDASSGFQAITPLLLVTNYLADIVADQMTETSKQLSVEESEKLREDVRKIIENPNLSDEVREAALAAISKKYRYSG
ncbi:MAG: ATP-binding protein, partial [Muribaculaceae bacterium]|nr:ATP-binding protein [Muribaculaceae bacterium]